MHAMRRGREWDVSGTLALCCGDRFASAIVVTGEDAMLRLHIIAIDTLHVRLAGHGTRY